MEPIEVPEWLTKDFLKACLQSDRNAFPVVDIIDYSVESAVPPGNNYGSLLMRSTIRYKVPGSFSGEEFISVIVKAPQTKGFDDVGPEVYDSLSSTEPRYYNAFISETYKLKEHDVVPKCYTSPNTKYIVMEDLKTKGFEMVDRMNLLDYDHCVLFAQASSKLHAFAIAIRKQNPSLIESFEMQAKNVKENIDKVMKVMLFNGVRCMAVYLEDKPDYKDFLDVIEVLVEDDNLWRMCEDVYNTVRPLMALTQGDPWCTNMMFKYDNRGRVDAIKILDFQYMRFTSPVVEFISFLWMSANLEVREFRMKDLLTIYNESLNTHLAALACSERLSFADLMTEATSLSPQVFMIVCCMLPAIIDDGGIDSSTFSENNSKMPVKETKFWKQYESSNFKKLYPRLLDIVREEGFLVDMNKRVNTIISRK